MSKPKKNDTWMPLYIGDYLADTSRLTTEQHGAYLLILMDYWRNGPPLDEEEELATITKLSVAQWRKHSPKIKPLFTSIDGRLHQKRAEEERQKAGMVSSKRSEAGKAGAAKKWGKTGGKQYGETMANDMANAMANAIAEPSSEGWQNDGPSQSHSHSQPNTNTESHHRVSLASEAKQSQADDVPANCEAWRSWFEAETGLHSDPYSVHDRKKFNSVAQHWVNGKVSIAQMRQAIAKARSESTTSIAYLPAYVDRVLSSMQQPTKPPTQADLNTLAAGFATGLYDRSEGDPFAPETPSEIIDGHTRLLAS